MSLHLAVNVWNHDWKQQRHNRVAMFMQFQNESIYYSLWIIRWDIWLMLWNLETETRELWRGIVKESRPLVRIINQYYFSTKEDYINMSWQTTKNFDLFVLIWKYFCYRCIWKIQQQSPEVIIHSDSSGIHWQYFHDCMRIT